MSRSSGGGKREEVITVLGGRRHHHKERHCDCKGTSPLVLFIISLGLHHMELVLRLLKLVTGVDISTRAVNKSGSPGKDVKRRIRTAAAAPNKVAFLLSILIFKFEKRTDFQLL